MNDKKKKFLIKQSWTLLIYIPMLIGATLLGIDRDVLLWEKLLGIGIVAASTIGFSIWIKIHLDKL